jgi:hypothetical protein
MRFAFFGRRFAALAAVLAATGLKSWRLGVFATGLALPLAVHVQAAQSDPQAVKPSQHGSVSQRIASTTIAIEYDRPVARGRELFGTLVPWGKIWCPGANDATTIEVSTNIKVSGQDLPAGKYSIWAEPQPEQWTVIFNKAHAVWHTRYPAGQDALRIQVAPRTGSHMETLAYYFPVVEGRRAELVLHWGTVVVPMAIDVP